MSTPPPRRQSSPLQTPRGAQFNHLDSSTGCPRPRAPLPSDPVPRAHPVVPPLVAPPATSLPPPRYPRWSKATKRRASPPSSRSVSAKRYREDPRPTGELDASKARTWGVRTSVERERYQGGVVGLVRRRRGESMCFKEITYNG